MYGRNIKECRLLTYFTVRNWKKEKTTDTGPTPKKKKKKPRREYFYSTDWEVVSTCGFYHDESGRGGGGSKGEGLSLRVNIIGVSVCVSVCLSLSVCVTVGVRCVCVLVCVCASVGVFWIHLFPPTLLVWFHFSFLFSPSRQTDDISDDIISFTSSWCSFCSGSWSRPGCCLQTAPTRRTPEGGQRVWTSRR